MSEARAVKGVDSDSVAGEPGTRQDWGDWQSNRERALTLGAEASPAQLLAWLEQAIVFAHRAGALPRKK